MKGNQYLHILYHFIYKIFYFFNSTKRLGSTVFDYYSGKSIHIFWIFIGMIFNELETLLVISFTYDGFFNILIRKIILILNCIKKIKQTRFEESVINFIIMKGRTLVSLFAFSQSFECHWYPNIFWFLTHSKFNLVGGWSFCMGWHTINKKRGFESNSWKRRCGFRKWKMKLEKRISSGLEDLCKEWVKHYKTK